MSAADLLATIKMTPEERDAKHQAEVEAMAASLLEHGTKVIGGEPTTDQHIAILYVALADLIVRMKHR